MAKQNHSLGIYFQFLGHIYLVAMISRMGFNQRDIIFHKLGDIYLAEKDILTRTKPSWFSINIRKVYCNPIQAVVCLSINVFIYPRNAIHFRPIKHKYFDSRENSIFHMFLTKEVCSIPAIWNLVKFTKKSQKVNAWYVLTPARLQIRAESDECIYN